MAKRIKVPKTIEDARAIVIEVLGRQRDVSLYATWYFSSRDGRSVDSVEYHLAVYGDGHEKILDVAAATPADLVRDTINAFEAFCNRRTSDGPRLPCLGEQGPGPGRRGIPVLGAQAHPHVVLPDGRSGGLSRRAGDAGPREKERSVIIDVKQFKGGHSKGR